MLFGRFNLFSAMDAFPLTDAVLEFDDSSSVAIRPAGRALDGVGPRSELGALCQVVGRGGPDWPVRGSPGRVLRTGRGVDSGATGTAGLTAAGFAVFGAVFRLGLQRKRRLRPVKPKEGGRNEVVIDQAIAIGDTAVGGLVGTHWPRVPVATGCSREPQTIADARGPREGRSGRQVVEVRVSKVAQSRRSAGAWCVAHRRSHPPRSGLRRLSAASL